MFIKQIQKQNKKEGKTFYHYRLVESYRIGDKVRHRTILNLGEVPEIHGKHDKKILADRIEELVYKQKSIFSPSNDIEEQAQKFARKISEQNLLDQEHEEEKDESDYQNVDLNSIESEGVREIGAEWMCKQMADELDIQGFLQKQGWNKKWQQLGEISIISKAVFAVSENKTAQWLRDNSGLLEFYDFDFDDVNRHQLYQASSKLYEEKVALEDYLFGKTRELFTPQDHILLYDLTNTYFEGRKADSEKARHGHSKEKRKDAKLMVLGVVTDINGFVKYSRFYEGNMADSNTLMDTLKALEKRGAQRDQKPVVVLDAGIATEGNLSTLTEKGYDYLCVSRSDIKDYQAHLDEDKKVELRDRRDNPIELQKLQDEGRTDTALYVYSQEKQVKEEAIDGKLQARYEAELQKIEAALHKKHGVKQTDKVWQRIGRAQQKYPRVSKYYDIHVENEGSTVTSLTWEKQNPEKEQDQGVYFLRTTLNTHDESTLWQIYNTLREIEATFRVLKTDLNLRPVYHQKDIYCEAHLFLGILAYQLVCAIRQRLKQSGIRYDWHNIVRIMNTQKVMTTSLKGEGQNYFIRHCSRPTPEALTIYKALGYNSLPFKNKKSVVPH